jgi:asparagine synthase (glutamine-hydrolysing)
LIIGERRRGVQSPNWFATLTERRAAIAAEARLLEASPLARRLIDLPRLDALLADWPPDATAAQARFDDYRLALERAVHTGQFIRWAEGAN